MKPISESDLYSLYFNEGWEDIMPFPDFKARCELVGMEITKEEEVEHT